MLMDSKAQLEALAKLFADEAQTDLLVYNGDILRDHDARFIATCRGRERNENVLLVLVTEGGDPDAAYRISRCLQESYKTFSCLVSGYCKSAGSLLAIGASEIVMGDQGELGPIDVQMSKKDELWEYESGLTVMAALKAVHERALSAFEHFFLNIKGRSGGRVTLKTAMENASQLTEGLFAPLYAQLDPIHIGEAARATAIATNYALRLDIDSDNLQGDALDQIIGGYPSHGFVIDRSEAATLFKNVREPNSMELQLIEVLGNLALKPESGPQRPVFKYLDYDEDANGQAEGDAAGEEQEAASDTAPE